VKIEFVGNALPDELEPDEGEKWHLPAQKYCFSCRKVTTFVRCFVCGKRFCLGHAYEETESVDGHPIATYPLCYHCEKVNGL